MQRGFFLVVGVGVLGCKDVADSGNWQQTSNLFGGWLGGSLAWRRRCRPRTIGHGFPNVWQRGTFFNVRLKHAFFRRRTQEELKLVVGAGSFTSGSDEIVNCQEMSPAIHFLVFWAVPN
jgi:hypothetical protein